MKPETIQRALISRMLDQWDEETCYHSSITAIMEHPRVSDLRVMGRKVVVPIIIERLQRNQINWGYFSLLHEMTGANPVKREERGKVRLTSQRWIEWHTANG